MGVYLTYNNLALKDGSGAQVQRIFAIYSLAKKNQNWVLAFANLGN